MKMYIPLIKLKNFITYDKYEEKEFFRKSKRNKIEYF